MSTQGVGRPEDYGPSQDFSVVVKNKGTDSKPWKWVIYSAGRKSPMISSRENFASMAEANKAGKQALKKFLEQPEGTRPQLLSGS